MIYLESDPSTPAQIELNPSMFNYKYVYVIKEVEGVWCWNFSWTHSPTQIELTSSNPSLVQLELLICLKEVEGIILRIFSRKYYPHTDPHTDWA